MSTTRHEESIEKYIQSIKTDHLAMIQDPRIILTNLFRCYFKVVPAKFTFFNQKAHAIRNVLRALFYDELRKPTRIGLEEVIERVEQALSSEGAPFSSELEAMWIAFYKYYAPVLPTPPANSFFARILHQARHYTTVMRARAASQSIVTMLDASAKPVKRCAAAFEFKYLHNGAKLKLTTHFAALDKMCSASEWYVRRDIKRMLVCTSLKIEEWAAAVAYLVRREGRFSDAATADYLMPILRHLNRNKFLLDVALQQLIIERISEHFTGRIAVLVMAELMTMDMIVVECKIEMSNLLQVKFKRDLVKNLKKDDIAALLSFEQTRTSMLCALLDECTGGAKGYPGEMDDCGKILIQLTADRRAEAEIVLKKLFEYNFQRGCYELIRFVMESPTPDNCRERAKEKLREALPLFNGIDTKLAYFALHGKQLPVDEVDNFWLEIIAIITNIRERTQHSSLSNKFFELLELSNIPQSYHAAIRLAVKRALLTGQFPLYTAHDLAPKLLQLIPTEQHAEFSDECFEALNNDNSETRQVAFILLASMNMLTPTRRSLAIARLLNGLSADDGCVWIRDHLVALVQSDKEIECVVHFINQHLSELNDYKFCHFLEYMIEKMPFKPQHFCQFITALLDILEKQLNQTGEIDGKIRSTIRFLLEIKIPMFHHVPNITTVIGRGVGLLFLFFQRYGLESKCKISYRRYLNHEPLTLLLNFLDVVPQAAATRLNIAFVVEWLHALGRVLLRDIANDTSQYGPNFSSGCDEVLRLINYFPLQTQIVLLTHAEQLPRGVNIMMREMIQAKLDVQERCTEILMPELWRKVFKHM